MGTVTVLDDDDVPKKTPKATIIRRVILVALALTATGWLVYTRLLVKKFGLGEPCGSNMHCKFEAPKCLKSSVDGDGVCSRACANDNECAEGIKCVKVELEEYDERGRPLEGGYCFPQAILDARKKKKDAGAVVEKHDSWVDIPESPGFEGEVDFKVRPGRPGKPDRAEKWLVKGSLARRATGAHEIFDAASMRVFHVDEKNQSFTVSGLSAPAKPSPKSSFLKTERKDRVAERDCEIWTFENDSDTYEMCVVNGASFAGWEGNFPLWLHELAVRNAFPLRVLHKTTAVPQFATELIAIKVDAKPIEATQFVIPKTFKNKH